MSTPSGNPTSMHEGKHQHATKEEARRHADTERARHGGRWNVYKCLWCEHWHVGHISPAQARRQGKGRQKFRADAWA